MLRNQRGSITIELIISTVLIAVLVISLHTTTQLTASTLKRTQEVHTYEATVLQKLTDLDGLSKASVPTLNGTSEVINGVKFSYTYTMSPYNTLTLKIHSKFNSLEQDFYKDWLNN